MTSVRPYQDGQSCVSCESLFVDLFLQYIWLQTKYGAATQCALGLADGEQMERLWSYLRKFSGMTKQMLPENRVDTLSEALQYYARKVISKLRKF